MVLPEKAIQGLSPRLIEVGPHSARAAPSSKYFADLGEAREGLCY